MEPPDQTKTILPIGELRNLLLRHPWFSEKLLFKILDPADVIRTLMTNPGLYRYVDISGLGRFYATVDEPDATLIGAVRWETIRRFMYRFFLIYKQAKGINIFLHSLSPGIQADGDFIIPIHPKPFYYRLWVDLGGCEPPALGFIQNPPTQFGAADNQEDIVLTIDPKRVKDLALQIALNWKTNKKVEIWSPGNQTPTKVQPDRAGKKSIVFLSKTKITQAIQNRLRKTGSNQEALSNELGALSAKLGKEDWELLVRLGRVPFVNAMGLSYVLKGKSDTECLARVDQLINYGLVQTLQNTVEKDRLFLTPKGIELLRVWWNTDQESFRRFQNWPTKINDQGSLYYSVQSIGSDHIHDRLVLDFCLTLVIHASVISSDQERLNVELISTKSARKIYPIKIFKGEELFTEPRIVSPDAILNLCFQNLDGTNDLASQPSTPNHQKLETEICLEFDRSTMNQKQLEEKMDRYQAFYQSNHSVDWPLLLWVIEGDSKREDEVLGFLKDNQILGCTVLLDRLLLPRDHPYWAAHPELKPTALAANVTINVAPFRQVYRFPNKEGLYFIVNAASLR